MESERPWFYPSSRAGTRLAHTRDTEEAGVVERSEDGAAGVRLESWVWAELADLEAHCTEFGLNFLRGAAIGGLEQRPRADLF